MYILGTLVVWSGVIQACVPTSKGRQVLGIVGAIAIGAGFSLAGITMFKSVV
ncbi:hypothetical protein D3C75_969610 [compost metagenome]